MVIHGSTRYVSVFLTLLSMHLSKFKYKFGPTAMLGHFLQNSLRTLVVIAVFALLSACASLPAADSTVSSTNTQSEDSSENRVENAKDSAEAIAREEKEAAISRLPDMELDAQLLEQLLIADLASYSGDWTTAAENALAAAQSSQDHRLARLAALLSMRAQAYDEAVLSAKLWAELNPDSQDSSTTLLLAELGIGNADAAYEEFTRRRGDDPIDDHIREVGGILVRQSNAEAANAVAQRFVDDFPESAQVALSSAYVAEHFKNEELSEAWLQAALDLDPNWDLAAQMKANILRRQGKIEERKNYVKEFIEANPESIAMRINFAAELAREEQFQSALDTMKGVIKDDPQNVSALSYSAALAQQLEQDDLAKNYYKKALRVDPGNDEIRWSLARFAVREQKYVQAERYYDEIADRQFYFRAQLQVANMRYQIAGLKSAINTLRALEPRTEGEYVDRATTRHYLLMQDNQYEEAFSAINETLAYLPNNIELVYARALVAAELRELETAESDFRFIIERQPQHADALNALGYTLADQTDRYAEAKVLIEQALKLRPTAAHILDSMGWVLFRLEQYDEAIEYLQQAYDTSAEVEVAAHLGEVLWVNGDQERARIIWQQAFDKDADNSLLVKTLDRFNVELDASANGATAKNP